MASWEKWEQAGSECGCWNAAPVQFYWPFGFLFGEEQKQTPQFKLLLVRVSAAFHWKH